MGCSAPSGNSCRWRNRRWALSLFYFMGSHGDERSESRGDGNVSRKSRQLAETTARRKLPQLAVVDFGCVYGLSIG
jgi:hypothetical protein